MIKYLDLRKKIMRIEKREIQILTLIFMIGKIVLIVVLKQEFI